MVCFVIVGFGCLVGSGFHAMFGGWVCGFGCLVVVLLGGSLADLLFSLLV